jgi:hypothetical protein
MGWSPEVRQNIVGVLLDLAANIDTHRVLLVAAVDDRGTVTIVRREKPHASMFEALGVVDFIRDDLKKVLGPLFQPRATPFREDTP